MSRVQEQRMAAAVTPGQVRAATLQHAGMQADTLFASAFRTNMITQHMNQQLWEEHQLLTRRVRRRRAEESRRRAQSSWVAQLMPRWSSLYQQDDEKMLELIGLQIQTNNRVFEWCQAHMQQHLQLSDRQRRDLDRMMSVHKKGWQSFLKDSLVKVLQLGGVAALIYVANDYFNNGSLAWNAVVGALGRHDLKLQRLLPQRVLDWITRKLVKHGMGPTTVQDRFFASLLKAVRSRCNTVACRWLGLRAGGGLAPPQDDPFELRAPAQDRWVSTGLPLIDKRL